MFLLKIYCCLFPYCTVLIKFLLLFLPNDLFPTITQGAELAKIPCWRKTGLLFVAFWVEVLYLPNGILNNCK